MDFNLLVGAINLWTSGFPKEVTFEFSNIFFFFLVSYYICKFLLRILSSDFSFQRSVLPNPWLRIGPSMLKYWASFQLKTIHRGLWVAQSSDLAASGQSNISVQPNLLFKCYHFPCTPWCGDKELKALFYCRGQQTFSVKGQLVNNWALGAIWSLSQQSSTM